MIIPRTTGDFPDHPSQDKLGKIPNTIMGDAPTRES